MPPLRPTGGFIEVGADHVGEQPALLQLVGGLLIIGAGVLLQVRSPQEIAEHEAVPAEAAPG